MSVLKMDNFILLRCLLILSIYSSLRIHIQAAPKGRLCINYIAPNLNAPYDTDQDSEEIFNATAPTQTQLVGEAEEIICSTEFNFCFTLWQVGLNDTKTIVRQGCWDNSDKKSSCQQEQCISDRPVYLSHRFCCCSTDLCNGNISSYDAVETAESVISSQTDLPELARFQTVWSSPIIWICSISATLITVAVLVFLSCRRAPKSRPENTALAPTGPGYSSNLQNVDNLSVCSLIGRGKYGTVWKGMVNEQPVAVKIFPAHYKNYFINERNIYSLSFMECSSLLSYFGCDERKTLDGNTEYFLVLSLAPLGCLQDWLIQNTTNYVTFCRMAKSITRGLSHLHTEIKKGNQTKPCVCHRDLNTRNILVKADLTCCIADFGFALKAYGSRYEYKGEMAVAETKSINEVGTLRYMAPEVLEGAVNLRDCETALKQIDVYALGLVLWELCVRCHDLYPHGHAVPDYKAPYEEEIGKNPTFEQMQVLVARHKARPLFPPAWGGGPASKITKDTCEDCWDHDAEARLTALCVEERIHELANLKPRSHANRGSSPPINANNLNALSSQASYSQSASSNMTNSSDTGMVLPPNQIISTTKNHIVHPNEKNHAIFSHQIQPFQGRNPCQERNLAPTPKNNQILFEKSKKHSFVQKTQENSLSCLEDDVSVEDLLSSNTRIISEQAILGEGFPKQINTEKKLRGWHGVRALIQKKLFRRIPYTSNNTEPEEKSNLVDNKLALRIEAPSPTREMRVNLVDAKSIYHNGTVQTRLEATNLRPNNLDLAPINVRVNSISADNSATVRNISDELSSVYKKLPGNNINEQFTIVNRTPKLVISRSANAVKNLNNHTSEERLIKRQRSLEIFHEVFGNKGSIERLRDPSQRVKTPGDVPPSVRKVRASKTLSLYDDRMMDSSGIHTL